MKKLIKSNIRGLQCDNENCDFIDMEIKAVDYSDWIDVPCPKCGRSLLTKADYDAVMNLLKYTTNVERELNGRNTVSVKMNGSGEMFPQKK
jgi:hypothetical protein